jgi:hypothetical protein
MQFTDEYPRPFRQEYRDPPTMVYEPKLYLNSTKIRGTNIIVSSTDSGLEAFSHNPTRGSFAALPDRTAANTNYANQRFLSY